MVTEESVRVEQGHARIGHRRKWMRRYADEPRLVS